MSRPLVIKGVVCPHCADLCDDLRLTVEGDRIAAVEVEREAARAFFLGHQLDTISIGQITLDHSRKASLYSSGSEGPDECQEQLERPLANDDAATP